MLKKYLSLFIITVFSMQAWAQTTIIDPTTAGAFEGANFTADGWTVANNATTNQWVQSTGATAGFTGTQCAYITNNAAGTPPPHAYTNSASRVSALYRDVSVPAGETTILLSFRWINLGETSFDRLQVWAVPTSFTPPNVTTGITSTGTAPTGRVALGTGATGYVNSATWGTANITIPAAYAGTSFRLVFQWRNDGSGGSNPPIAVDDVSLISSCSGATTATVSPYTLTTATLNANTFSGATGYNFRYREVGSPTWTNAPSNPYATPSAPITGLTANTSYEFQVSALGPVCNVWSASANFLTGYCLVSTTNSGDYTSAFSTTGAIANVSYTASSQPAGSYSNQTAQSFQATAGTTINFSHTYVGGSNGVNVWVDWNNDLDFLDAGENVFTLANTSATKTGSFTIPGGTAVGNYRVRIRSQFGSTSNPPSCGNVDWGSTVDYNLQVVAPPSCISPTAPTATPTSTSSADVSWTAASPVPGVGYIYNVSTSATPPADGTGTSTTGTSASVTGLSANTTYYLHVQSDCGGSSYSFWATTSFFTGHCLSTASSTSYFISNFATTGGLTNISNNSAGISAAGYGDFTAQSCSNYIGASTNFTSTWNTTGGVGYGIWIDWNNDLDFSDANEVVYITSGYNFTNSYSGVINIPASTPNGNYRMRIRIDYNSSVPSPCGAITEGETEDYTFVVSAPPACTMPSALGAGNFSGGSADLTWTCSSCTGTYEIEYGAQGFTQGTGTTVTSSSSPRNVTGLTVGNNYGFYVRQDCGGGSFSTWAGPFNFRVPSPGDVCGAPIVISSLPYSTTDNTSNYGDDYDIADRPALTGAQVANGSGIGDYLTGDDVVYSFTPATTGCYNVNLSGVGTWVGLFMFQGCAPFTSTVGYHTNSTGATRSLPNLNLTAGTTYYIVISTFPTPQSTAYTLTVDACPTCPQPTVLGSNTVLSTTANLTWTSNASSSLFDIYYGPTPLTAPTGATTPTVDDYNGGAGASITYGATGLTANTAYQYYVREDCGGGDVSTWSGPHSFTTPPPPPANDNCAGAITFPTIPTTGACASVTVNNTGATQSLAGCTGTADDDMWYSFTVPTGQTTINYSTTNISGSGDRAFQLFDACAGTSLFCLDDESGSFTGLTAGSTYVLRVYSFFNASATNFSLCLSIPPSPPANDNCAGAKPLNLCSAPDTTRGLGGATQSLTAGICGGTPDEDVWYSFVAPPSGAVTITLFSTYDGVIELRDGACNGTYFDCQDAALSNDYEDLPASGLTPGVTYYFRVYSYGAARPSASDYIVLNVAEAGCWLGTFNNNWNAAGNWSDFAVPNSCAANVTIPAGTPFSPSITTGSFTVGNVNIASGVNLTLTGNNLNVCGNWAAGTGANAVTVGSGNVVLQGTAAQTISGNTNFERLTVNATGSYTNSGTVTISQRYTPQAGSLNNAGTMTFLSTSPTAIATIDLNPANTGSLTGNITAQRFIPIGGSNQHYVSSPLNSLPLTQFGASGGSGSVVPTANCDETQLAVGSPYGTVFRYNEANGAGCSLAGWEVVSSGSAENARGYSAYLTGAGTPLSVNGVANMSSTYTKGGNTNTGWPIHFTLQGRQQSSGWALVGNPYLSTINLSDKTAAGFNNEAQVWQTSGPYSGTYQSIMMGSGSAFVAPFQGFMVRKTAVGGTADFTVGRTECVNNTSTFYKTSSNGTVSIVVNGNGFADVTKVVFDENSTNQFDITMDASKLPGRLVQPMLASKIGSDLYSINNLNSIATNPSVPLEFMPGTNGSYTFTFDDISTFDPTVMVYLEDKMSQNGWYDLRARNVQTFTCNTSDRKDRFVLHFTAPVQSDSKDADCDELGTIALEEISKGNWNVTISNAQGAIVHTQVLDKNNPVNVKSLVPGTYEVTFTGSNGYVATRQITISGVQPLVANISASTLTPNVNQSVQFNSSLNTSATVSWDFGDGNTSTIENPTHVYAAEGIYKVELIAVSNDGCTKSTTQNVNVRSVATGIENNNNSQEVIVNNIGNNVVVSFKGYTNENASITISNVLGQVLFTGNHNVSNTFNYTLKDVDTQVLIVKTTIDGKSITNKLALTSK